MLKTIMTLEGRKFELVLAAGERVQLAEQRFNEVQAEMNKTVQNFHACMELATGDGDPSTLFLDVTTGKVTREVPDQGNSSKPPRRSRRKAGKR